MPTRMIMGVGIITITTVIVIAMLAAMRITNMSIVTATIRHIRPVQIKPSPHFHNLHGLRGAVPPLLLAAAAKRV